MSDEEKKDETQPPADPQWERREFKVNAQMKSIIKATIPVTEAEIARLKRKLKKLQYGS